MKKNIITLVGLASLIMLSYVGIAQLSSSKKALQTEPDDEIEMVEAEESQPETHELPGGVRYRILKAGEGQAAKQGDYVTVHYTGTLDDNGKPGQKFDSSLDRGRPFSFKLGAGHVIHGWDIGVVSMRIGEERELIIPSDQGYGPRGHGPIPPNATLRFDVKLLEIKS